MHSLRNIVDPTREGEEHNGDDPEGRDLAHYGMGGVVAVPDGGHGDENEPDAGPERTKRKVAARMHLERRRMGFRF